MRYYQKFGKHVQNNCDGKLKPSQINHNTGILFCMTRKPLSWFALAMVNLLKMYNLGAFQLRAGLILRDPVHITQHSTCADLWTNPRMACNLYEKAWKNQREGNYKIFVTKITRMCRQQKLCQILSYQKFTFTQTRYGSRGASTTQYNEI